MIGFEKKKYKETEYVNELEAKRREEFEELIQEDLKEYLKTQLRFTVSDDKDYKYNMYFLDKLIFVDTYQWDIEQLFTFPIGRAVKEIYEESLKPNKEEKAEIEEFRKSEIEKEIKNTEENFIQCKRCHKFYRKNSPYEHRCDF